jgi:hypothetical protein
VGLRGVPRPSGRPWEQEARGLAWFINRDNCNDDNPRSECNLDDPLDNISSDLTLECVREGLKSGLVTIHDPQTGEPDGDCSYALIRDTSVKNGIVDYNLVGKEAGVLGVYRSCFEGRSDTQKLRLYNPSNPSAGHLTLDEAVFLRPTCEIDDGKNSALTVLRNGADKPTEGISDLFKSCIYGAYEPVKWKSYMTYSARCSDAFHKASYQQTAADKRLTIDRGCDAGAVIVYDHILRSNDARVEAGDPNTSTLAEFKCLLNKIDDFEFPGCE